MTTTLADPLPMPMDFIPQEPSAPKKPKVLQRSVRGIPIHFDDEPPTIQTTEEASVADLLQQPTETDPSSMPHLERVFYDQAQNKLYKLFNDGTWEYIIVRGYNPTYQ